jgi:hypothetical protein
VPVSLASKETGVYRSEPHTWASFDSVGYSVNSKKKAQVAAWHGAFSCSSQISDI